MLAPALAKTGHVDEARGVIGALLKRYPKLTVTRFAKETRFHPSYQETLLDGLRDAGLPEG